MGRRVLPKKDPSVEYRHLVSQVDDLSTGFDPQSLYAVPQPLEVEVGSGKGLFILNESGRNPQHNFLGNEVSRKYSEFAAYRLAQQQRRNAHMVSGDGLKLFHDFLADQSVTAVHVYFPDPWWKARHRRRRVMRPSFVQDIQRVLQSGGVFHFWTDVEEYFEETVALLKSESDLTGPQAVTERPAEHDMDYRTHFERRMRKNGHPVFRSQFHKS